MKTHAALRWLLQLDRPAAPRSDAEISAEIEKNYRWNFTVNLLDGATFWFGISFISSTTIVPLFVSKLTDSPFIIGLVAVIAQGSWFLPQLFTANMVERLARKKPVVVNLGFFTERLPLWIVVGAAAIAGRSPGFALTLFLISYAWHGLGAGVIAAAWQDLLARIFPVERRGRVFGPTMFSGAATATASASFSAWLLENYRFPLNFVIIFAIAATSITISWVFIALTREPAQPATTPRRSNRQYWAELPRILGDDQNFRRYLTGRFILALGGLGAGFVTVAAVQRWDISDSTVGLFTASLLLGQTVGNLLFGVLADKYGHKLSLELTSLAAMMAYALAWLAPGPAYYFVVFGLMGVSSGGIIVSGILVVLEFCGPGKRPTYIGLSNTGTGLISAIAPLIGAYLAARNYNWLFALGAFISLLGFIVLRWWVQDPRHANHVGQSQTTEQPIRSSRYSENID
jgi:MFS family permease